MKKQFVYLLLMLLCLGGCETVKGVGQDLENTGDNIQDVAEEVANPEK